MFGPFLKGKYSGPLQLLICAHEAFFPKSNLLLCSGDVAVVLGYESRSLSPLTNVDVDDVHFHAPRCPR